MGISDINGLGNVTSLEKLNLSQNSISNIYIFQHTNSRFTLKELNLSGNQLQDIGPISLIPNLEKLDLSGNLIFDVQALAGLQNLRELYLQGNYLSEEQITALQLAIPNCVIIWQ